MTATDHAEHVALWCTCSPFAEDICEYRKLADKIIELFNPPDNDVAEVALVMDAVVLAAEFITAQPCTCTQAMVDNWESCPRCTALGQRAGKPVDR